MIVRIEYLVSGGYVKCSNQDQTDHCHYEFRFQKTEKGINIILSNVNKGLHRQEGDLTVYVRRRGFKTSDQDKFVIEQYAALTKFILRQWLK